MTLTEKDFRTLPEDDGMNQIICKTRVCKQILDNQQKAENFDRVMALICPTCKNQVINFCTCSVVLDKIRTETKDWDWPYNSGIQDLLTAKEE